MKKLFFLFPLFATLQSGSAIQRIVGASQTGTVSYNTTDPGFTVAGGASTAAYVGQVTASSASGTYLRNGWVLTAAHVAAGDFFLNNTTYTFDGQQQTIGQSGPNDTVRADLRLFHLTLSPNLAALTISSTGPTALSPTNAGTQIEMIGYGGGQGETYGLNRVTGFASNLTVGSYTSDYFVTNFGTTTAGGNSATNEYLVVTGDSGGGDFAGSSGAYLLYGINGAVDSNKNSLFVQLSTYKSQIDTVTATPEPSTWTMLGLGGLMGAVVLYRRRRIAE